VSGGREPRASARADKPNPKQNRDRKGADRVARVSFAGPWGPMKDAPKDAMAKRSAAMRTQTLLSTTWYYYNSDGNVTEVFTVKENPEPGEPQSSLTRLEYAINGQAVTYVVGETWGNGQDYNTTYAREFRCDGARQRYLNRELDPETLEPVPGGDVWSDYDGDEIYGDYMIDGQIVTNLRSFEPGIAKVDPWTNTGGANTSYYHTNQIGTTRLTTDSSGAAILPATYTAFGEKVGGENHRYGYAGAWGYQTHADFPYLHVGHRYYDPSTGRFLQRDPIGIRGGLNIHEYVGSRPVNRVDPSGLHDGGGWHWGRLPPDCPHPPPGKVPVNPGWPDDPDSPVYPYDEMEKDRDAHLANAFGCFVGLGATGFLGEGVAYAAWVLGGLFGGYAVWPL
ncbi:MAG: RHS repeat-associated core domain-containing protein, partial [Phycisphaerae bacterium]